MNYEVDKTYFLLNSICGLINKNSFVVLYWDLINDKNYLYVRNSVFDLQKSMDIDKAGFSLACSASCHLYPLAQFSIALAFVHALKSCACHLSLLINLVFQTSLAHFYFERNESFPFGILLTGNLFDSTCAGLTVLIFQGRSPGNSK